MERLARDVDRNCGRNDALTASTGAGRACARRLAHLAIANVTRDQDETFLNTGYKKFVLDGEDGRIYCRELIWGHRLVRGRNCVAGEALNFGIRNSG